MADVFTKEKRSEIMARIRSKNTALEASFTKKLSKVVYPAGYRYRKHDSKLAGKPDIVFPGPRVAVFIDGCFWHGCPVHGADVFRGPNAEKWRDKLAANKARDLRA